MKSKIKNLFKLGALLLVFISIVFLINCFGSKETTNSIKDEIIETNSDISGVPIEIYFTKGESHNHPLMAIWLEDIEGNYLQTIYVAQSIAKGVFGHGDKSKGKWMPGPIRRPAALPYWGHQWGVQAPDGYYLPTTENPLPDAVTGATPQANFSVKSKLDIDSRKSYKIYFEINQTWDWNEYWTNNKYPDDENYKTSCQPALVYSVTINFNDPKREYLFEAVGRSHHSGENGILYSDLNTITTALDIAKSIKLIIPNK